MILYARNIPAAFPPNLPGLRGFQYIVTQNLIDVSDGDIPLCDAKEGNLVGNKWFMRATLTPSAWIGLIKRSPCGISQNSLKAFLILIAVAPFGIDHAIQVLESVLFAGQIDMILDFVLGKAAGEIKVDECAGIILEVLFGGRQSFGFQFLAGLFFKRFQLCDATGAQR